MKKAYIVGITGGIASGKSAVSGILEKLGAYIIDADVVSREVIACGSEGEQKLKEAFPSAYLSGELDRNVLREIVFKDYENLRLLNSITHPLIKEKMADMVSKCEAETIFLVVPLMFETGCDLLCDYIVTIVSDEDKRINRLKSRNNSITEELALEIMRSQISENERITRANEVIVNNDSLEKLEAKVNEFYRKVTCAGK